MSETEIMCDICGEQHTSKYVHTLPCGHLFHYECIQKTFQYDRKRLNSCPLCGKASGLLPVVNNIPKVLRGIHYHKGQPLPNIPKLTCSVHLKSGKRKGEPCGCNCMIGKDICKRHNNSKLKKSTT